MNTFIFLPTTIPDANKPRKFSWKLFILNLDIRKKEK